jgi:hypothetical protein
VQQQQGECRDRLLGGFIHRATPDAETTPARPKAPLDTLGQYARLGVPGEEDQNPARRARPSSEARPGGRAMHDKDLQECRPRLSADYWPSCREAAAQELWGDVQSLRQHRAWPSSSSEP